MDGFKKRLRESIQLRLSLALCLAIGGIAVLTGALGFISALDEAHELQDSSLQQVASLARDGMLTPRSSNFISPPLHDEKESRMVVHFMLPEPPAADDVGAFYVPQNLASGFHNLTINGQVYRVLIEDIRNDIRVAVGQQVSVREQVALSAAVRTLVPFFILIPVLLYLVADLVKKIFLPIRRLADSVDRRGDRERVPLDAEHIPREIQPFIRAINRLLERIARSVELQRRFVADAAHELRSPLTALTLQAERLESAELPEESRQRVLQLRLGMKRARNLVEQLLSFSRTQSGHSAQLPAAEPTDIFTVVKDVIAELLPLAEEKSLDLGVIGEASVRVVARPSELFTLIRNIIHNAIQYTPTAGSIDVDIRQQGDWVMIEIEDNGCGIAAEQRERVFDAFYRLEGNDVTGSGLGLSIVKVIVEQLQGKVLLSAATRSPSGLNVTVFLPVNKI